MISFKEILSFASLKFDKIKVRIIRYICSPHSCRSRSSRVDTCRSLVPLCCAGTDCTLQTADHNFPPWNDLCYRYTHTADSSYQGDQGNHRNHDHICKILNITTSKQ